MEPAASIIRTFGGTRVVADICNVHRQTVVNWRLPANKGGTAGRVPQKHIPALLRYAHEQGLSLGLADFIPTDVTEPQRTDAA